MAEIVMGQSPKGEFISNNPNSLLIHPACQPEDSLLKECKLRSLRRSGPGGQHRNKVETAVVIEHEPTGVRAEANERRCQKENRATAIFRLRLALAVTLRSQWISQLESTGGDPSMAAGEPSATAGPEISILWRSRIQNGRISVASNHRDFPALLAEAMDHVCAQHWNVAAAASRLNVSSSQLVKMLRMHPPALTLVNSYRQGCGLTPLK